MSQGKSVKFAQETEGAYPDTTRTAEVMTLQDDDEIDLLTPIEIPVTIPA